MPAPPVAYPVPCQPPPVVYAGPAPVYQVQQPVPCYPAPTMYVGPPPAPPMPVRPAVRTVQGTWYREIGPVMCVLVARDGPDLLFEVLGPAASRAFSADPNPTAAPQ